MYKKYIKRLLDILISLIIIIILFPIYVIVGILIKIIDNYNIFYKQYRTGINGSKFKIYKFNTMKDNKVTKLGNILRRTSIDELPQFINVLKGDMSIVGPRPWISDYYDNLTAEQKKRVSIKPGITGLAQVNGRNNINILKKIDYDLEYVNKISFLLDLKIIIKSFKAIIVKKEINDIDDYIKKEINNLKSKNINFNKIK